MIPNCAFFNAKKYNLGGLCKRNHEWGDTGKSLRMWDKNKTQLTNCVFCFEKKKSYQQVYDLVTKVNSLSLFYSTGFTWWGYGDNPLRAYVEYGFRIVDKSTIKIQEKCVNGHYWEDFNFSLNRFCKQTECAICRRLQYIERLDSGKNLQVVNNYKEKHPDTIKQIRKNCYWRHRDQILAERKTPEERAANRLRCRLRYQTEKGKEKAINNQGIRKNRKLAVSSIPYTLEEKQVRLMDFNHCCAYCGNFLQRSHPKPEHRLTWDHVIPLSKKGVEGLCNLIPVCKSCNCSKHDRDLFEWYSNYTHFSIKRWKRILEIVGEYYTSFYKKSID